MTCLKKQWVLFAWSFVLGGYQTNSQIRRWSLCIWTRQHLPCLHLYAPDLGEDVDQYTPVLLMPPGRACVISPQPETYLKGIVDGRKMLEPQLPSILWVVGPVLCVPRLSLLINSSACLGPYLGADVAGVSVAWHWEMGSVAKRSTFAKAPMAPVEKEHWPQGLFSTQSGIQRYFWNSESRPSLLQLTVFKIQRGPAWHGRF